MTTDQEKINIHHALVVVFLMVSSFVYGQVPVGSTSATDHEVKVHDRDKVFVFRPSKRSRLHAKEREGQPISKVKPKAEERGIERKGKSVQKPKPHRTRHGAGKVARVFKRHNHFAKKEAARSRSRSTRRPE